ncbi:hypothetical protein GGS26DRAFT_589689 [Hypomontagnella submonticulosa]|nr:hypothetical protein GGS26DRAFT_589689 [Hypomontagnella submonticulosa]
MALSLYVDGNAGKQLLRDGTGADAKFDCGYYSANVHKHVLSSRSDWFKAAFQYDSYVDLGGVLDPLLAEWLVTWCYTGDVSFIGQPNVGLLNFEACMRFERVADLFAIKEVQGQIRKLMEQAIDSLVKFSLRHFILGKPHHSYQGLLQTTYTKFFAAVAYAYELDDQWAQKLFVSMVERTHMWLYDNPHFRLICKQIPGYNQALEAKYAEKAGQEKWTAQPPDNCFFCGAGSQAGGGGQLEIFWQETIVIDGRIFPVCNHCVDAGCLVPAREQGPVLIQQATNY